MKAADPKGKRAVSFALRNLTIFTILIAVTCLSFTALFYHQLSSSTKQALLDEGGLMVRLLAYNSRLGVFSENPGLIEDATAGIFQDVNVREVSIYTLDGNLLKRASRGESRPEGRATSTEPDRAAVLKSLVETRDVVRFETRDGLQFWAPVFSGSRMPSPGEHLQTDSGAVQGRLIGYVSLDLTKEFLRRNLRSLLYRSLATGLVALLAGFIMAYLINRRLTEPLQRLTANVIAFGQSGAAEQMPIEREDEIGILALAFNNMTASLQAREREKEALEERLSQAQKMEAIGTLTGGIAHDFNNILTIVKGYAEIMLAELKKGEKPIAFAERLIVTSNRAISLTRNLLTFSRKQIIDPRPILLNDCVRELKGQLLGLLDSRIELKKDLSTGDLCVLADPGQIDQILMNLVTNARDAMPTGGVLTVTTRVLKAKGLVSKLRLPEHLGSFAMLAVSDTGRGMDARVQERIFDPFFTTKGVGRGTGLGLSIVYGIIKQNNWFIEVESQPGCGSTFRIYIPILESETAQIAEESRPAAPVPGVETILLAEDDADVREVSKMTLEQNGYRVIEAVDGEDAVAKFIQNREKIQLLLFDVMMPGRDGKNAFEEIRKSEPGIKALFFSGYPADVIDRQGIRTTPGMHFISKPVSENDLTAKIRQVLDA